MLNPNEIGKRARGILQGSVIGLLFGMWSFAATGALATFFVVWRNESWSMAQLIIGLGLVQCIPGMVCGAVIGAIIGGIKKTIPAFLAGELGGFITYWFFFVRGYSSYPLVNISAIVGILLTGSVLVRLLDLVFPTYARTQVPRSVQWIGVGGFALLALPLVLYLVHGMFVIGESYINQFKWHQRGSQNYTVSAHSIDFPSIWGDVNVKNGKIVGVKIGDSHPSGSLERYQILTVNGMFDTIRSHAFTPLCWEMISYNPDFGYPKSVRFNNAFMLIPGVEGEIGIDVDELKIE